MSSKSFTGLRSRLRRKIPCDKKNRCWDDKKVDAHHAIIPTAKTGNISLSENENSYIFYILKLHYIYYRRKTK